MKSKTCFCFILFILCNISLFSQKNYPCELELSSKADKLYKQGRKAQEKGDNDKASSLFKAAIEVQDDWAAPYYSLAMQTIRKIERSEEQNSSLFKTAINYFEKVVNICPEYNHEAYLHLGKLYYSIENYSEAVKYLEIFMEDPDKIKKATQYDEAEWFLSYSKAYEQLYGNPVPFAPQPVAGLSTSNDEYLARLSPDEEYMLYSRRTINAPNNKIHTSKKITETFTISQRIAGDSFTVGTPMPSPPFNITENEGSPTITLDNKYLVFTRCANIPIGESHEIYYNCDLYYSEYKGGEWTTAKNLGNLINRKDSWESQASISPDGKVLFFASDRPGGTGENYNTDIYFSLRDANGNWQKAQNLGPIINTPGNERSPFIHSDGKTLYFSSNGHVGIGGYDVFFSRQSNAGTWQRPQNIGYPINTEKDEVGMFINTMGDKAYFSTNAISGNYDICQFDLYQEARPQSVMLIKGQINNISSSVNQAENTIIELKNLKNKTTEKININEKTGKYAVIIKDTTTDHLLTVKQKGYVYEAKYISAKMIIDSNRHINNIDFSMQSIEKGESYKINDINFATNSYELTSASSLVLEVLIEFLQDNPSINIEIQGHTDNIGKREDNMILSENRAKAVYEYLISNDINPKRLSYKGFADTRPIANNATEKGRALNRRTVFVILNE